MTVAGGGASYDNGVPATATELIGPGGGSFDNYGNFYFIEGVGSHRIRKIDSRGIISTIAGTGVSGYSGDGGPATRAQLNYPAGMCIDIHGNFYISDWYNHDIRKIDSMGIISTFAGNGIAAFSGDGHPATEASLTPTGICVDSIGDIYFLDSTARVREINTSGIINTIAGNGVLGYSGDYGPATDAEIYPAYGICIDKTHNLLFSADDRIRKVTLATGIINTIAGTGTYLYNGDNIRADTANFTAYVITIDDTGNIYVGDIGNQRVRKIDTFGFIHTVAGTGISGFSGDGGIADSAKIHDPEGLAVDICGNLYLGDEGNNRIRKIIFDPSCVAAIDTAGTLAAMAYASAFNVPKAYPNPMEDELHVQAQVPAQSVTIINAAGNIMYRSANYSSFYTINTSGYPAGIYLVLITDYDGRRYIEKVIKD